MSGQDADCIEVRERVRALEVSADYGQREMAEIREQISEITRLIGSLTAALKWLTVVVAVTTTLTLGDRVLPLVAAMIGR